jgi:hypothetical protein
VAHIYPDDDEEAKVRADDGGVEVVQCFRGLQLASVIEFCRGLGRRTYGDEEVADIMGNVHRESHFRKVVAIARCDQRNRDYVMENEFLEVLSGLLQLQKQNDGLLGPVAGLEQVVCLEDTLVLLMGIALKHRRCVEVPHGAMPHDVHPKRSKDPKVDGGIDLLHEARLLGSASNATSDGPGPDDSLHEELARKTQENRVKGDKCDIVHAFAVHDRAALCFRGIRIGEEDGYAERIFFGRVDSVAAEDDDYDDQRVEPCVLQGNLLPSC